MPQASDDLIPAGGCVFLIHSFLILLEAFTDRILRSNSRNLNVFIIFSDFFGHVTTEQVRKSLPLRLPYLCTKSAYFYTNFIASFLKLHPNARADQKTASAYIWLVGVVNSKKFFHTKQFWIVLWSRTLVATFIFPAASIWSPTAASKLRAVKSTLLNKSCSNEKILADLLLKLLKFV